MTKTEKGQQGMPERECLLWREFGVCGVRCGLIVVFVVVWWCGLCGVSFGEVKGRVLMERRGDFDPGSSAWNGLSGLTAQASELGIRMETPQIWDWRRADIRVPILIISPQDEKLSTKPLLDFVSGGGRVAIAEDFGAGLSLLRAFYLDGYRFGVTKRQWQPKKDIDLHRTYPAVGQDADFLLRQASFLFLNVPQWLVRRNALCEPLLRSRPYNSTLEDFDQGGQVLFRVQHGWGVVVAISDPSLLINHMIVYGDNRRFANNLLRYLTLPVKSKRVILLWGDFVWHGEWSPSESSMTAVTSAFWEGALWANKNLTSMTSLLSSYPPYWPQDGKLGGKPVRSKARTLSRVEVEKQFGLYPYMAKGGLLVVLVMTWLGWLFFYLPGTWRVGRYDPGLERQMHKIPNRFEEQVENYREGYISYLWPAVLLKEELVAFLADAFELSEVLRGRDPREWDREVLRLLEEKIRTRSASSELIESLPSLRRLILEIPGRHQWNDIAKKTVHAKDLERYYEEAMLCLRALGLQDDFRQPYLRDGA